MLGLVRTKLLVEAVHVTGLGYHVHHGKEIGNH